MHSNKIPKAADPLVRLAVKGLAGARNGNVRLFINSKEVIAADLYDLIGNPDTPLIPGKEALFDIRKQEVTLARAAARVAIKAGREYCRIGIALLKSVLGPTHNGNWHAAGFRTPSLAMPRHPEPMLIQFRRYLEVNPAQEKADSGFTAAEAHAKMVAIQAAELAVAAAEAGKLVAKQERDKAQRALKKRLSRLRAELEQLLSPEDGAWKEFGFRRPADGRIPEPVEEVKVTAGVPGTAVAEWEQASRAESYRVSWSLDGVETEVGLFADRRILIAELPPGATVMVRVTARNAAGETRPTEVAFAVP